ncbi:MAG TPA: lauroyl acyltransferase [Stellaceae bacterium]|nr:lauroyl acyltransferase [Stellaceae bacterium]
MTDIPLPPEPTPPDIAWRYRIEAWLAALMIGALGLLPLGWASALGGFTGRLIGPFLGITKRARLNLRAAFPELTATEIETIVRGMWENLGRVAYEYPHLKKIKVFSGDRVEVRGLDNLKSAIAAGRRVIMFSGHLGNWEIAALAGGQYGLDIAQIYRAANNPLVDTMLARLRGDSGELIPKGAVASRRAVAALRRGGHLSLLVDQKLNDGIAVPFFGREAMTAPALAMLALRFDCDVLPVRVERLKGTHFRLSVYPKLPRLDSGDRTADILALMTEVNRTLETWIRERPEQWFWLHRRWPV